MKPQPPNPTHKRMIREKKTITHMINLYCKNHHKTNTNNNNNELCPECQQFKEYAHLRLDKCPFQDKKSTCGKCKIQCYKPDMKQQAHKIMSYSGPRLLLHHPNLAIRHIWDKHRKAPTLNKN
ncbi:MAG: nitrous oxide-stimulated promoter family protein [Candidatus Bathyarchaeota archaeon]|nr:nitrous oxide-stimulated promoter family protein [Candidatus Termiticorpusculum sp.]